MSSYIRYITNEYVITIVDFTKESKMTIAYFTNDSTHSATYMYQILSDGVTNPMYISILTKGEYPIHIVFQDVFASYKGWALLNFLAI